MKSLQWGIIGIALLIIAIWWFLPDSVVRDVSAMGATIEPKYIADALSSSVYRAFGLLCLTLGITFLICGILERLRFK